LRFAEIELDQAIHWYGAQAPGLGDAFLIEVLSAGFLARSAQALTCTTVNRGDIYLGSKAMPVVGHLRFTLHGVVF
jgi:hypothetical protein